MKKNLFVFLRVVVTTLVFGERADIFVAKDGTGNFNSIQSVLNSIPRNNSKHIIILVKNGVYNEKTIGYPKLYLNCR